MLDDYIKRSDAKNAYKNSLKKDNHRTAEGSIIHAQEHNHILHILDKLPAANVEPINRWISVDERLPESLVDVLCWYEYRAMKGTHVGEMVEAYGFGYYNKFFDFWGGEVSNGCDTRVIAWQPLPEPPKGAEK